MNRTHAAVLTEHERCRERREIDGLGQLGRRLFGRTGDEERIADGELAHEGTHLQQFLDGTLFQTGTDPLEVEIAAWVNAASVWQQLRGSASSLDSQLAREAELGYQVARWGEGAMRDFLKALYP